MTLNPYNRQLFHKLIVVSELSLLKINYQDIYNDDRIERCTYMHACLSKIDMANLISI